MSTTSAARLACFKQMAEEAFSQEMADAGGAPVRYGWPRLAARVGWAVGHGKRRADWPTYTEELILRDHVVAFARRTGFRWDVVKEHADTEQETVFEVVSRQE